MPSVLGPRGRGGPAGAPGWGVKRGTGPSYPRGVYIAHIPPDSWGQASWRQGQDKMRQGSRETQVQMPALSPVGCVTWHSAPRLSGPQHSHLQNGENNNTGWQRLAACCGPGSVRMSTLYEQQGAGGAGTGTQVSGTSNPGSDPPTQDAWLACSFLKKW